MKAIKHILILAALLYIAFTAELRAQLPNAWQITDHSIATGSTNFYAFNLDAPSQTAATNAGFDFSVNARFVANFSGSHAMAMIYGLGANRFLVWWNLNASNDLTAQLEGGLTYTLTTNGTGTALYHTHEIVYTNGAASFLFDGKVLTNNWPPSGNSWTAGQVVWGSVSSGGEGQMNFHSVNFTVAGLGTVASYDAGTAPDLAQDPTNVSFGWTHAPAVLLTGTAVTNVSPDTAESLLAVVTGWPGNLTNSSATLAGTVYPTNSSVQVWFEWGTDTNYGNVTPVQDLGVIASGTGFQATVSNLVGGPDYHYRAVASNFVGVVKGEDQTFNLRFVQDYALPDRSDHSLDSGQNRFVSVADFNNDGLLDLLVSGSYPHVPSYAFTELLQNMGDGTFSNVTYLAPGLAGIHGPSAWGDFDNDGRLDFLIAGDDGTNRQIQLWWNTGNGFTNVPLPGVPGLGETGGYESVSDFGPAVAWTDYDNDGKLDFMIMGESDAGQIVQLWRNTGSGFTNVPIPGLLALDVPSLAWGDYDSDGQSDFLVEGGTVMPTTNHITPALWRNTGGSFTNVPIPGLPSLAKTYGSAVAFGDYDNDGMLDFLIAGLGNGVLSTSKLICQLWRNSNDGFTNVPVPGLVGIADGMIAWGDYNNDGLPDFVVAGTTNANFNMDYSIFSRLFENTGDGFVQRSLQAFPDVASYGPHGQGADGLDGFFAGSLVFADFNRDGRLDIVISGHFYSPDRDVWYGPRLFFSNMAVPTNAPPAAPGNLSATVSGGRVSLRWTAPADDHTPPAGLSYNVRIGTTPGGRDIASPPALPAGTLTLPQMGAARNGFSTFYNLPPGTYYWSVQAVDGAFAGSPFATEQQFTVGPLLVNPIRLPDGEFEFDFTNPTALNFDVLVSTNVGLPLMNWTDLGPATSLGGSLYEFTDPGAIGQPQRFYLLRSP